MSHELVTPTPVRRRAVLDGWGVPGPIEERAGRRLLRLVDPGSDEGRRLLGEGEVELIGPEGESLGAIALDEACARLRRRLERCAVRYGADLPTRGRTSTPS